MIPYGDFTFFGLLLYPVLVTLVLGLLGRAGRWWALLFTVVAVVLQYYYRSTFGSREIWILIGFGVWEYTVVRAFQASGARPGWPFYTAVGASLAPLVMSKLCPLISPGNEFGFLGLSYVTFRALDVVFCLRDKVLGHFNSADFLGYLFFFPTISSGPIDRYRRFTSDLGIKRNRTEFLRDLDAAIHRVFRGFLYKFIIAALINHYWLERTASGPNWGRILSYMYGYSLYLFFDFAGYCAFAIALSYLFGVHTPENFDRPFLARNIRDFWNRWHITLSFWFRDHIYMRFLLTARRRQWFRNKHTAATVAYFLSFGLMGLWHGLRPQYIVYGLYQALLLSAFDLSSRWRKVDRRQRDSRWSHAVGVLITFQFVCFGFLIFSGRLTAARLSPRDGLVERADCEQISGWIWDQGAPDTSFSVDLFDRDRYLATVPANVYRQDLSDAGYGSGRHVFILPTPLPLKDGQSHVIYARVAGTRELLRGTPKAITCRPQQ